MASNSSMQKKPFRVVIVGGGVTGLTMSHGLQLANIDHVVLEKHKEVVSLHGAALMIWPTVARVFDQFGFLDKVVANAEPVKDEFKRWPDGTICYMGNFVGAQRKYFGGNTVVVMNRTMLVRYLHENLPDMSRVKTNKRVQRIEYLDSGVRVHLTDGTVEEGDIVVGSDGIHSMTKESMWDWAEKHDTSAIPEADKSVSFSEFRGIYAVSKLQPEWGLGLSDTHITYGHDRTGLMFTQPGVVMWAHIFKSEEGRRSPPAPFDNSPEAADALVKQWGEVNFTDKIKLKDLWKHKDRHGYVNIEEGLLSKWHAGRTVLLGDAAHKMTADLGMGANISIEDAVVLCNILQRELKSDPNRHPSQSELSAMFTEYQKNRFGRAKFWCDISGKATRNNSYQSWGGRFRAGYIMPWLSAKMEPFLAKGFANGPKIDYAPVRSIDETLEGWKMKSTPEELAADEAKKAKAEQGGAGWMSYLLLTSTVGIAAAYIATTGAHRDLPALFKSVTSSL